GWDSRADISGNARHFCDGEFNSKDTREILHSAKDLGVCIASRILIHPCKTILYSILAVFTHSSRKSINHCALLNAQIGLNFLIGTEAHQTI
ncbi:hypothetical protein, partial [Granulicatella adiacens]